LVEILNYPLGSSQDDQEIHKIDIRNCKIEEVNKEMLTRPMKWQNEAINPERIREFSETLSSLLEKNSPVRKINFYRSQLPPFILSLIRLKRQMYRPEAGPGCFFSSNTNMHTYFKQINIIISVLSCVYYRLDFHLLRP
jgi:hypothetical protein